MTDDNTRDSRNVATLLALVGVIAASLFIIALVAMVAPHVLGIFLVLGLFGGAVAFHYLAWGWWLPRLLREKEPEEAIAPTSES